jgi:hypothetical protein
MRWLWLFPSIALGGFVGVAALAVHRDAVWLGASPLPWGAVLAVAAPTAVGLVLRTHTLVLLGFLFGWLATILGSLSEGPGGDFLLVSDPIGWGFLGGSVLMVTLVFALGAAAYRRREEATRA